MAVDNDVFSLSSSTTTVPYDYEFIPMVTFSPTTDGDYSGAITILSNDLDELERLPLVSTATATSPPIVSVAPASLSSNLLTGETETQFLTISNSGASDLYFTVNATNVDSRWALPELEQEETPTILTTEDIRNIWNRDDVFSSGVTQDRNQYETIPDLQETGSYWLMTHKTTTPHMIRRIFITK